MMMCRMKRAVAVLLLAIMVSVSSLALADYTESDAWNVAKHVVTQTLEERGCTKLRFAIVDYSEVILFDGWYQ